MTVLSATESTLIFVYADVQVRDIIKRVQNIINNIEKFACQ